MTKEDKQIIDRAVKEEWRIGDRTRLRRLLEKNLKLYFENTELENKIADIKANCDLAIEGREVKIKELTDRLEDLQEQNSHMFNTIALQEQQIVDLKDFVLKVSKFLHNNNNVRPDNLVYKERDVLLIKELKLFEKWELSK